MGVFVRRVKTASGATAVQIVHKRGRTVLGIDHIGSAHDDEQLAVLLRAAQSRLHTGQQILPLEDVVGGRPIGTPVVEGTASLIVWEALEAVYASLGFDQIADTWSRRAPLGWDTSDPTPVGRAISFLFSDLSSGITGEMIHVDGGFHAMGTDILP